MTNEDLITACTNLLRRTRDPDAITICTELLKRIATLSLPSPPKVSRRDYMREYMRARRNKKQANPFA